MDIDELRSQVLALVDRADLDLEDEDLDRQLLLEQLIRDVRKVAGVNPYAGYGPCRDCTAGYGEACMNLMTGEPKPFGSRHHRRV